MVLTPPTHHPKAQTANSTTTPPQKPQIPLLTIQKHPVLRIEPVNYAKPSTNILCDAVSKRCDVVLKRPATVLKHSARVYKWRDTVPELHARVSKQYNNVLKCYAHVSKRPR
jgi:hypothetical protein